MGPSSNSHREKITVVSRMEKENALPCAAANGKSLLLSGAKTRNVVHALFHYFLGAELFSGVVDLKMKK